MKALSLWTPRSLLAAALLLTATSLSAQTIRYEGKPGSKLRVEGTSSIHDWHADSLVVGGFMELDSNYVIDPSVKEVPPLKVVPKVEVNIPVRSLKSSGKKLMDNVMHDAMKANDHAKILYVLKEMSLKLGGHNAGEPIRFNTKGDLTVAGVTKPVTMIVSFEKADGDRLKVSGVADLKMTDFGISPPAPKIALGSVTTGDDIKIIFEWLTAKAEAAPAK